MIPSEPESGICAIGMDELDRVWRIAWLHGYRVGLQVGVESDMIVLHVRDMMRERTVIAIIAKSISEASVMLLDRMIGDGWIPREDESYPIRGTG